MVSFVVRLWKIDRSKRDLEADTYEEAVRRLDANVKQPDVTRAVIYRQDKGLRSAVRVWTNEVD